MNAVYGDPYYKPYYGPTGKVDFNWFGESWAIFKRDAGTWMGVMAIYAVLYVGVVLAVALATSAGSVAKGASTAPLSGTGSTSSPLMAVLEFVIYGFQLFGSASFYTMALKAVRRQPISFTDGFAGGPVVLSLLVYYILAGLFSLLGVLALIIGVIFTSGLAFAGFAIACDRENPIVALSKSINGMKSDWGMAGVFLVVLGLLVGVSALPCYLGMLVTLPMYHICSALAYRDMVGMDGIIDPQTPYGYQPMYAPPPPSTESGVWPPPPGSQTGYDGASPAYGQDPGSSQWPPSPPQPSTRPPYDSGNAQPPDNSSHGA